jgi:YesN/AraC family two-component response regulator
MKTNKKEIEILKTITVLYVEDEEEIQQQLSVFLESKIGALYTALDGRKGLELFRKYKPDVVITDIRMPTMDGLELAKAIREIDQEVPIIIITAFNEEEFFLQSNEIGIDKHLLKPTDPYELLDALIIKRQIAH